MSKICNDCGWEIEQNAVTGEWSSSRVVAPFGDVFENTTCGNLGKTRHYPREMAKI